ncbi:hypothetical protein [Rhizobium leguminosarum]|uniref:hypothetical protein n=1 Tax=Rhizobium leguminosarum TaxID=384 RepID=UPI002E0FD7F8|nr:hypothetical protein U8Q02_41475 [Rhizobium leguminosarum]
MKITRRLLVAAASVALATSAVGAPLKPLTPTSNVVETKTKVQIFTIETGKGLDDVASILRAISGNGVFRHGQTNVQALVAKDSPLLEGDIRHLLGRIGKVSDVTDTLLVGKSGASVPVAVGLEIPYVKERIVETDAQGKVRTTEKKDVIKTGFAVDVKSTLRKDGTIKLAFSQRVATLIHLQKADFGDGEIQLPRVRQTSIAFDASVDAGQAVLYVQFDENGGERLLAPHNVVVTLVTPEDVR